MTAAEDARRHAYESISESLHPTDPRKVQRQLDEAKRELRGLVLTKWCAVIGGSASLVALVLSFGAWFPEGLVPVAFLVWIASLAALFFVVRGVDTEPSITRARRRVGDLQDRWDDLKEQQ